jgi:hypothetical protein
MGRNHKKVEIRGCGGRIVPVDLPARDHRENKPAVQVVVRYANETRMVHHYSTPSARKPWLRGFTIGEDPRCTFPVEAPAGRARFPLVSTQGEEFVLTFTAQMEGTVSIDGTDRRSLSELAQHRLVQPSRRVPGGLELPIQPGFHARVRVGMVTFVIESVQRAQPFPRSRPLAWLLRSARQPYTWSLMGASVFVWLLHLLVAHPCVELTQPRDDNQKQTNRIWKIVRAHIAATGANRRKASEKRIRKEREDHLFCLFEIEAPWIQASSIGLYHSHHLRHSFGDPVIDAHLSCVEKVPFAWKSYFRWKNFFHEQKLGLNVDANNGRFGLEYWRHQHDDVDDTLGALIGHVSRLSTNLRTLELGTDLRGGMAGPQFGLGKTVLWQKSLDALGEVGTFDGRPVIISSTSRASVSSKCAAAPIAGLIAPVSESVACNAASLRDLLMARLRWADLGPADCRHLFQVLRNRSLQLSVSAKPSREEDCKVDNSAHQPPPVLGVLRAMGQVDNRCHKVPRVTVLPSVQDHLLRAVVSRCFLALTRAD